MIAPQLWLLVTFPTVTAAMAMEQRCHAAGLPGRLIPVPRSITAGCGMAWRCDPALRQRLEEMLQGMTYEGIYELEF